MKSSGGVFKDLNKFMSYEGATWKFSGSTIIYCITRKETEELATILKGKYCESNIESHRSFFQR